MNSNKDIIRLNTITRDDMHVKNILDHATSTALYSYEEVNGQWTKDNVEGTLMIYEREAPPHNMIKIINKLSKFNFIEPLTSSCEIQVKPPYLLFKNSKGSIYGIWFNDESDVHRISSMIKEKIESEIHPVSQPHSNILNDPAVAVARSAGGDIMTMLSLAHGEFESKRQEPSRMVTTVTSAGSDLVRPSPLRVNDTNSTNVVADFLAKVGGGGGNTGSGSGRTLHSPSSGVPLNIGVAPSSGTNPVLQKLFQGAAAIGGQASVVSATGVCGSGVSAPISIPGSSSHSHTVPHSASLTGSAPMSLQELEGKLKENLHVNSSRSEDSHLQLKLTTAIAPKTMDGSSSLLSPQVFTSSHVKEMESQIKSDLLRSYTNLTSSSSLSHLGMDSKTLNGSDEPLHEEGSSALHGGITPLTQEQLVQAFTLLLKKDEFVRQLHEAYVQALHKSLKGSI